MIKRCLRHALPLLCLMLLPLAAVADDTCRRLTATGNPEYPPYLWRDPRNPQQLMGANADLLKHLGKQPPAWSGCARVTPLPTGNGRT